MRTVEKTTTWKDNWNNVIRDVLFADDKLRELMLLPKNCTIIQFIDKYFIEDENTDELMTNERVRISYYDAKGRDTGNQNVRLRYKEFDIYVHKDVLHNATNDRLQNRYDLIADRIKYLLLRNDRVCNLHFELEEDGYNLFTKAIGYKRYHISFSYKTTV